MERDRNELKKGHPMRNPMRGTPFSQDLDRGDGFESDTSRNNFRHTPPTCGGGVRVERGGTRAGYKEERGGGIRPTTNDQPGAVMRNPVRDPVRGVDLTVLGYVVGPFTPSEAAPGNRGQFASRTREPASRLTPLMARSPSFEAPIHFLNIFVPCARPCARDH